MIAEMTFEIEDFRRQIPFYLTSDPAQKELVSGLKALSEGSTKGYFFPSKEDPYAQDVLQGDGYRGFQVYSFSSGGQIETRGIILSNSCDISPENQRALPPKVTFAPILRLSKLRDRLEDQGLQAAQIDPRLNAIRSQSITNMFYLPAEAPLDDECVVLLDDLHSMPVEVHQRSAEKLFTLSMAAFYLFVFKLSIHFCRLHENVDRSKFATAL